MSLCTVEVVHHWIPIDTETLEPRPCECGFESANPDADPVLQISEHASDCPAAVEVKIEPCGTPMFGTIEMETGVCSTCASRWKNRRFTEAGAETVTKAVAKAFKRDRTHKLLLRLRVLKRETKDGKTAESLSEIIEAIQKGEI